jgi:hypothetical protein
MLVVFPTTAQSQFLHFYMLWLQINEQMRLITLYIKDMYVHLPISGIIQTSSFWLNKHNNVNKHLHQQVLNLLNTIIKQNCFQNENQTFRPEKGVAVGSPISSTIAEVYMHYLENIYKRQAAYCTSGSGEHIYISII